MKLIVYLLVAAIAYEITCLVVGTFASETAQIISGLVAGFLTFAALLKSK